MISLTPRERVSLLCKCRLVLTMTLLLLSQPAGADPHAVLTSPSTAFPSVVEAESLPGHVSQADIESGQWTTPQLVEAGHRLFVSRFTISDGLGRPAATGNPFPTLRRVPLLEQVSFARGQGPDSNSCVSCHAQPVVGGAGDFAVNVFTGLGMRQLPTQSLDREFSNERGTPSLHGTGLIELLAREITADLHRIRSAAKTQAKMSGHTVRKALISKGIQFGAITATPAGQISTAEVEGIDRDLIIRPFGAKGVIVSLRDFTINAANLHHGMQAVERFGKRQTGTHDFDQDGIQNELTVGDITALTIYQATLNLPGNVLPNSPVKKGIVKRGKDLFTQVGCAKCHIPELVLERSLFFEPNPHNFKGNLRPRKDTKSTVVDLAVEASSPHVERMDDGHFMVRAFTDFKRHKISDSERPHFKNEIVSERLLPTDVFLTARLWTVGNTAPYGHRGDLVTLAETIEHHGGEAAKSRRQYEKLAKRDQESVRTFLRTLQIIPAGSPQSILETKVLPLPYISETVAEERLQATDTGG